MTPGTQPAQLGPPGFWSRLRLAGSLLVGVKGIGEVVEHFRRLGLSGGAPGSGTSGGPDRPFEQVVALYRAVSFVSDGIAGMPLMIGTGEDQVLASGPLVDLAARPHPDVSAEEFWRQTAGWLLLCGRVHWIREGLPGQGVQSLQPVGGVQMTPDVAGDGTLRGWKYRPAGTRTGSEIPLPVESVYTILSPKFDPSNPYDGVAAAGVARRAINQLWKAEVANEASLDNGMEFSGVFNLASQPTPQQLADTRAALDDRHAGVGNRRRPLMLFGDMKWQQTQASFTDMEFTTLQKMKAADIAIAIGVDPAAIGYVEGGRYEFVKAAKAAAWIDRILPFAAWLAGHFQRCAVDSYRGDQSMSWSESLLPSKMRTLPAYRRLSLGRRRAAMQQASKDVYCWFDDSAVPAVQEARLSVADQAVKWASIGVPLNDILEATGAPFEPQKWGNTWWRALSLVDVQDASTAPGAADPSGTPAPGTPGDGQDAAGGGGTAQDKPATEEPAGGAPEDATPAKAVQRALSEATKAGLWEQWRATWAGVERQAASRISRHFYELRADVLRRLEEAAPQISPPGKGGPTAEVQLFDYDLGAFARDAHAPAGVRAMGKATIPIVARSVIGQILVSISAGAKDRLIVSIRPLLRLAGQLGGQQSMDEAAAAEGKPADQAQAFNMADPGVGRAMRDREIRISGSDDTLRLRLANQLADGIGKQETVSQLAERVRKEFGFAGTRSATIARTEVGGAVEDARQAGRSQAGVPRKSWLGSRRETSRPWHMATEAETMAHPIANTADFVLAQTGAVTPYPRASGLPPEECVNCACSTIPRYDDPRKDVALLTHLMTRGFTTIDDLRPRNGVAERGADHA